jgi:hypothetical protein
MCVRMYVRGAWSWLCTGADGAYEGAADEDADAARGGEGGRDPKGVPAADDGPVEPPGTDGDARLPSVVGVAVAAGSGAAPSSRARTVCTLGTPALTRTSYSA